jgi:hypothetical protein
MKIRSLKQALHWLFLIVGVFSLITMAFSVNTYLNYAREGYGLDISVTEAWLNNGKLVLRLRVENPGGLDIYLGGSGIVGNLTLADTYNISLQELKIRAGNTTTVIISTEISAAEFDSILLTGQTDMALNLRVTVPERGLTTGIRIEEKNLEMRA